MKELKSLGDPVNELEIEPIKSIDYKEAVDTILGGAVDTGPDHPNYTKAVELKKDLGLSTSETFTVQNPITGKKAEVVLNRQGTTAQNLAMIMLAPDATKEQQQSMLATYLFEQGRESSSFLTELFLSKGTHTKETQAFKRQVRYDFEAFASMISIELANIGQYLQSIDIKAPTEVFNELGDRFVKVSTAIQTQREKITNERLREKGFGVYISTSGEAFSIFDDEIEEAVAKDKYETENGQVQDRNEEVDGDSGVQEAEVL